MLEADKVKPISDETPIYCIRVKGRLSPEWADWFGDMAITTAEGGDTLLTGPVDQAALHGLLHQVRDLGVPLLAVNLVADSQERDLGASSPVRRGSLFNQEGEK